MALTSMWPASQGASSSRSPVRMLTAPPGRSEVARASAARPRRADEPRTRPRRRRFLRPAREDPGDEPSERGLRRREDGDDAGGLGHGEVEVRAGTRDSSSDHLRQLVGPSRVPDDAVDRGVDLVAAGARRARDRTPAPPSSRPAGRAPGRGCTPSAPTSRETPHERRERRRGRPCARRGRRSGPSDSYVRPDSERGNAPPM